MRPSPRLLGASRLPLTSKQGNKDFYKGTRQSYAPGLKLRTGAPGTYTRKGGKYRIDDERVRIFIGPPGGLQNYEERSAHPLKPYVHQGVDTAAAKMHSIPSLDPRRVLAQDLRSRPRLTTSDPSSSSPSASSFLSSSPSASSSYHPSPSSDTLFEDSPSEGSSFALAKGKGKKKTGLDWKSVKMARRKMTDEQREGLKMQARRENFEGMAILMNDPEWEPALIDLSATNEEGDEAGENGEGVETERRLDEQVKETQTAAPQ